MEDSISRLMHNHYHARRSWESWCYLSNLQLKNDATHVRTYVDQNPLLYHLRYLAMKDFHIQLYKVLRKTRNNPDNIFTALENSSISDRSLQLDLLEQNRSAIDSIITARDKFYSHFDPDYKNHITGVTISEFHRTLGAIEHALIALTSRERVQEMLNTIPSKDDLYLTV